MFNHTPSRLLPILAVLAVAGCGSSSTPSSAPSSGATNSATGGGALSADAASAATGDIPDSQNFLTFNDPALRISMLYPEGWAVLQDASGATVKDKNNLVRITVSSGPAPTTASVQAQLAAMRSANPALAAGTPQAVSLSSGPAVKVTYRTTSAPNPVTGKRVVLTVDRYVLAHSGRLAIVDLGTPVGVDNVDAYKRMIESFRWR